MFYPLYCSINTNVQDLINAFIQHLSKRLELSLLELAGINKSLDLLLEDGLDLSTSLSVELA